MSEGPEKNTDTSALWNPREHIIITQAEYVALRRAVDNAIEALKASNSHIRIPVSPDSGIAQRRIGRNETAIVMLEHAQAFGEEE